MATSTILLGLIAFSCFQQAQNMRDTRIFPTTADRFYNAVQELREVKKTGTIITGEEQKLLRHAIAKVHEFYENMERIETQTNSELQETNASETCKSDLLLNLILRDRSEIRSRVALCSDKYKEEIKEAADIARRTMSTGTFIVGSPDALVKKFRACEDDECRREVLAETDSVLAKEEDLADKVFVGTYWTYAELLSDFKEGCLMKGEEDYQFMAKHVILLAETCEDT